jgi:hypothetical protein
MAVRTTDIAVAAIIEVDEDIDLTPFIEAASAMVDDVCVPLGYNSTRLELIERWLSAHMYAVRDPRTIRERADVLEEQFQSRVDLGLNVTHYGQMAMRIDVKGGLAALEKRIKNGTASLPVVFWLGVARDEDE